ncbi:hypothetical protein BSKO_10696 [Bryopsis sp. KO-2023]|nr:hypothetical protein BSKO_10696 [Bryopsis sp. KO-2023]
MTSLFVSYLVQQVVNKRLHRVLGFYLGAMEGSPPSCLSHLCSAATLFSDFAVGGYPTGDPARSFFATPVSGDHSRIPEAPSLVNRKAKRKGVDQDIILMDLLTFSWESMN